MRSTSPAPFLRVPSSTNISSIAEEEEEGDTTDKMYGSNNSLNNPSAGGCPVITFTADDNLSNHNSNANSVPDSPTLEKKGPPVTPFEDTASADNLRSYLQRMIDAGHLPGSRGSISGEAYSDESGNEEEE